MRKRVFWEGELVGVGCSELVWGPMPGQHWFGSMGALFSTSVMYITPFFLSLIKYLFGKD